MTSKKSENVNIPLHQLAIDNKDNQLQLDNLVNEPGTKKSRYPLDKENIQPDQLAKDNKENQRSLDNLFNEPETKLSRNPSNDENIKPDQLTLDKENQRQLVNPIKESEIKISSSSVGEENIQPNQLAIKNKENQRPMVNLVNEPETKKSSNLKGVVKTNVMEPVPLQPHVNHEPPARHVEENCHENDVGSAAPSAVLVGTSDPPPPLHDPLPPVPQGNDPPNNGPPDNGPPDNGPPDEPEANGHRQVALLPRNNEHEESSRHARQFLRSHYHFHFRSIILIIFFLQVAISGVLVAWIKNIKYSGLDWRIIFLFVVWGLWICSYCYTVGMDHKRCRLMDPIAHMPSANHHNDFFYVSFRKGIVWIEKWRK